MKVLIADDTLYRRNRSKHVGLLSRVFDHIDKRYYRGFRMLTLGWSDGISSLLSTDTALGDEEIVTAPLGAAPEMTRELFRSLIERFLRELPPIYEARWLLAWQNNAAYCFGAIPPWPHGSNQMALALSSKHPSIC